MSKLQDAARGYLDSVVIERIREMPDEWADVETIHRAVCTRFGDEAPSVMQVVRSLIRHAENGRVVSGSGGKYKVAT